MILDTIAQKTIERIEEAKKAIPQSILLERIEAVKQAGEEQPAYLFEQTLKKEGLSFICEVKKASPSKGVIAEHFPYVEIAKEYTKAGADAISVLTEPFFFQGENKFLEEIRKEVKTPLLRKDFTVDEYMIYEAKAMGANAVLLICAILDDIQLRDYFQLADSLGLSALVETHSEDEVERALKIGARIVGVNNRNLKDFTVDIQNSVRLRKLVPENILFVSESGMKTPEDMKVLRENKTDAVLIGETFMRSEDKEGLLKAFRG